MVQAASEVFVNSYDSEVKLAYQGVKSLRECVRVKTGVIGATHRFPKAGSGVATQHNRGNDVVAMNAGRSKVTVTLEDWDAFDYEDTLDLNKLNFDDKKIIAENTVKAIGRREDQLILDALDAGSTTTVGGAGLGMSMTLLLAAQQTLDENNVPDEDRTIVYSSQQKSQLLATTQVTSSDYNSVKALVHGEIDTFLGFTFKMIGNRDEGGLPRPSGVERDGYAFHKAAVGLAIGHDMQTMVDWVPVKTAWQIGAVYSAGAGVIDVNGVVTIHTDDVID